MRTLIAHHIQKKINEICSKSKSEKNQRINIYIRLLFIPEITNKIKNCFESLHIIVS